MTTSQRVRILSPHSISKGYSMSVPARLRHTWNPCAFGRILPQASQLNATYAAHQWHSIVWLASSSLSAGGPKWGMKEPRSIGTLRFSGKVDASNSHLHALQRWTGVRYTPSWSK
jgi:hypothetical protein